MLVQHHHSIPRRLPRSSPPPSEYDYNADISPPTVEKIKSNDSTQSQPDSSLDATGSASFTIRRARIEDAAAIAELGATVFSTSFGFSIPPKDLNAFLDEAYTAEAIEDDIRCSRKHIFVACSKPSAVDLSDSSDLSTASVSEDSNDETLEDEIIGFAQLTEDTTEPCLSHVSGAVELQRLYVTTSQHGRGVGQRLARKVESVAWSLGYTALWLGVWEGNFKAQTIYERLGFAKVGDHEFKIGKCIQMDWIMSKSL